MYAIIKLINLRIGSLAHMNHPEMKKNYIALLNFVKAFENLKTK